MKIEFVKHRILQDDAWWFELGITWQTTEWNKHKYLFSIALSFWSIYIRYGGSND
jgi:hypothetical protein